MNFHEADPYLYIIMEYIEHGDLARYTDSAIAMPEYRVQTVAAQICSALQYLHKNKITHRDIKPGNILVANETPDVFKLSDFGLSKMVHDQTFLQTFCGTILYCAPEIYPGYSTVLSGVPQKRRRQERQRTQPYENSVDTWAFGAVLYHLLCGRAPWTGNPGDHREAMLNNIMKTPVEWELLLQAGVSHVGIDFVRKMLVIEPSHRATDAQSLGHAWISAITGCENGLEEEDVTMTNEADLLAPIEEDIDEELIASQSQLNLNEGSADDISDESVDASILDDVRSSKRIRAEANDHEPNGILSHRANQISATAGPPLFGEIGNSALVSSGVFNYTAHAALDMPFEESHDHSDAPASAMNSQVHSVGDSQHVISEEVSQHSLQYPRTLPNSAYIGSAPSLLGAESHLNHLNMASPESGRSVPSPDSVSPPPRTPRSREMSPLQSPTRSNKRPSQEAFMTDEDHRSKRPRSIQSPPLPTSTSPRQYARPQGSSLAEKFVVPTTSTHRHPPASSASIPVDRVNVPNTGPVTAKSGGIPQSPMGNIKEAVTTRSQSRQLNMAQNDQQSAKQETSRNKATEPLPPSSPSHSKSNSSSTIRSIPRSSPPPPPVTTGGKVYGRLTPMPGSIETPEIVLTRRLTYYGRDPSGTFVHPDRLDTRIAKNAVDIIFWRPGIEKTQDWHKAPDEVHAIIATRTSTVIRVNGVKLDKGKDCWKYGKLRTGDVISVFEPTSRENGSPEGRAAEFLRFRAEFYIGKSKATRPATEPFVVEKETRKFADNQLRRSRESSATGSMRVEADHAPGESPTPMPMPTPMPTTRTRTTATVEAITDGDAEAP